MVLDAHMAINTSSNQEQEGLRYSLARNIEKQFI
jgi:hypothetical protein